MDKLTLGKILEAMGYQDETRCCKACKYFVPDDCSGAHNAEPRHCKLSPAIKVPVNDYGRCNHFCPPIP